MITRSYNFSNACTHATVRWRCASFLRRSFSKVTGKGQQDDRISIDLRSDTLTRPTAGMLEAMMSAEVGDDVYCEDPTINELEARTAELLGKEAALFVPSGTMGNSIAIGEHTRGEHGAEAIMGDLCHINRYEAGGVSAVWNVMPSLVRNTANGRLDLSAVEAALSRGYDVHYSIPRVVCLEVTHNVCGGRTLGNNKQETLAYIEEVRRLCSKYGDDGGDISLHCDGARSLNAAVALGVTPAELLQSFDSVSMCLSKGLGCPVGSVLAGGAEFIHNARRLRKMLGGGMRQGGILAAAGLYALESDWRAMLSRDHANAKRLGKMLNDISGFSVNMDDIDSNIICCDVDVGTVDGLVHRLRAEHGIAMSASQYNSSSETLARIRFVTHRDLDDEDIDIAAKAMRSIMKELGEAH